MPPLDSASPKAADQQAALVEVAVESPPVLSDAEERFVLEYVATGGNGARAYLRINPSVTYGAAKVQASRLMARPNVIARVEELRAELQAQAKVDLVDAVVRLDGWAGGDMRDVAEWDHLGLKVKPSTELIPEAAALVQEVEFTNTDNGRKVRVRLVDRLAAQKELNAILGLRKVAVEHGGEVKHRIMALPLAQPSVDEWRERYAPKQVKPTKVEVEQ